MAAECRPTASQITALTHRVRPPFPCSGHQVLCVRDQHQRSFTRSKAKLLYPGIYLRSGKVCLTPGRPPPLPNTMERAKTSVTSRTPPQPQRRSTVKEHDQTIALCRNCAKRTARNRPKPLAPSTTRQEPCLCLWIVIFWHSTLREVLGLSDIVMVLRCCRVIRCKGAAESWYVQKQESDELDRKLVGLSSTEKGTVIVERAARWREQLLLFSLLLPLLRSSAASLRKTFTPQS